MCDSNVPLIVWAGLGLHLADYIIRTEFQVQPLNLSIRQSSTGEIKKTPKTDQKVGEERESNVDI